MARNYQLIHDITVWKNNGTDRFGQPSFTKSFKRGRWNDEQRLYYAEDGRQVRGRSTVYGGEDLASFGDYMALGKRDDLTPPNDSYDVKQVRRIDNQRGTRTEYTYIL